MRAALLVLLGAAVAACTTEPFKLPDPPYQDDPAGARYVNAEGTGQVFFSGGTMYIGPTEREAQRLHRGGREAHVSGTPTNDCSDERFLCLRAERIVFAVPRERMSAGATYSTHGVSFVVERCADDACSIAEIHTLCERGEGGACSSPDDEGNTDEPPNLVNFTYARSAGVISISLLPHEPENQHALTMGRGILSAASPP